MTQGQELPRLPGSFFVDSSRNEVVAELRESGVENILFGAGATGRVALEVCRKLGVPISAFCDNSPGDHKEPPEYTPENAVKTFLHARYLLAVTDVHAAARQLAACGVDKTYSMGILQHDPAALKNPGTFGDEFAGYLKVKRCFSYHDGLLRHIEGRGISLPWLEVMITERCTLRCRNCSNLMPYYAAPRHRSTETILAEIDAICSCLDFLPEIRLIGGEPLLHPDIHRIAAHAGDKANIGDVFISTNGTLVPNEEQWKSLAGGGKVHFLITDYGPLSTKLERLVSEIRSRGMGGCVYRHPFWTECEIPAGRRGLAGEELREVFRKCPGASCFVLLDGKFHLCEYSANMARLGVMPDMAGNYIDLTPGMRKNAEPDACLARAVGGFAYGTVVLPACDYCPGFGDGCRKVKPAEQVGGVLRLPTAVK